MDKMKIGPLEKLARQMDICPKCGKPKNRGTVVCWGNCYRDPKTGFKHTQLDAEEWLKDNSKNLQ